MRPLLSVLYGGRQPVSSKASFENADGLFTPVCKPSQPSDLIEIFYKVR